MFHIFICKLKLNDDMTPTYINITDDSYNAMKYIMFLSTKYEDVAPLRLYEGNKNLDEFKNEFYEEFKEFELDELLHGRVYMEGVVNVIEMFLSYNHKDLKLIQTN